MCKVKIGSKKLHLLIYVPRCIFIKIVKFELNRIFYQISSDKTYVTRVELFWCTSEKLNQECSCYKTIKLLNYNSHQSINNYWCNENMSISTRGHWCNCHIDLYCLVFSHSVLTPASYYVYGAKRRHCTVQRARTPCNILSPRAKIDGRSAAHLYSKSQREADGSMNLREIDGALGQSLEAEDGPVLVSLPPLQHD